MRVKPLLLATLFSISFIIAQAQGTWLLINQQGVSLSYDKEFFLYCEEEKSDYYKITVYFANNSGKSVIYSGNALVYYDAIFTSKTCWTKVPLKNHIIQFLGEFENNIAKPWPTGSVRRDVCYIRTPKGQLPPDPYWKLNPFTFLETKKTTQPTTPQWSPWISDNCFQRIKYKYMGKELMNLNYQYHYYFQATNNYTETIFFVLSLKDATGNERFGTRRSIAPGKTIEFVEKMDQDYIKEMAIEKVCFKVDDSKYLPCDNERGLKPPTLNNAEIMADAKRAADLYCIWCKIANKEAEAPEGTSDEEYKRLHDQIEKAENESDAFDKLMEKKYDSEKNKAANVLYMKYWEAERKKCPCRPV